MRNVLKAQLLQTLKDLDDLLARHQVAYDVVIHDLHLRLAAIPARDVPTHMITEVRELFGGMGSLNDLYISRSNRHVVDDERAANADLRRLQGALWQLVGEE
jgi:uncharacterized protein DUF6966